MPMPVKPRGREPPQPQTFDISTGDEPSEDTSAFGSGGARKASAKKALAQLLLYRPRK